MGGKRSREDSQESSGGNFAMSLTALMMIMLAFFIMLTTLSQVDDRRKRLALGSLIGSFGILPGGMGTDVKGEISPSSNPIMSGVRREAFFRALGTLFKGEVAAGKVELVIKKDRVALRFRSDVLFRPGIGELSPAAFPLLDEVAAAIQVLGEPIRVEGHTDSTPGKKQLSNWKLSLERAVSVARYLNEAGAVSAGLLSVAGYADTRPVLGPGRPDPERDRRVEIVFHRLLGI